MNDAEPVDHLVVVVADGQQVAGPKAMHHGLNERRSHERNPADCVGGQVGR
jgi:hypothetical protein